MPKARLLAPIGQALVVAGRQDSDVDRSVARTLVLLGVVALPLAVAAIAVGAGVVYVIW